MDNPEPYDTTALRTISHRWTVVALAMSGRLLQECPGSTALLDKLRRTLNIIAKTDGIIREREHHNLRLWYIARLVWDTFLRKKVKAVIGTGAMKRWWRQYHGHHERKVRGERTEQTSYQRDYQWKDYGLLPVPGYTVPVRPKLTHYSSTSGDRQARGFPAFLFYPWQIEGQAEPAPIDETVLRDANHRLAPQDEEKGDGCGGHNGTNNSNATHTPHPEEPGFARRLEGRTRYDTRNRGSP